MASPSVVMEAPRRSNKALLIGIAAVLVALVIGVAAALALGGDEGDDRADVQTAEQQDDLTTSTVSKPTEDSVTGNEEIDAVDDGSSARQIPAAVTPPVVVTTTTSPPDPLTELQDIAASQVRRVMALDGYWVPQISSKQVGLVADGITYDDAAILNDFRSNQARLSSDSTLLFWSSDVGSFKYGEYWITVIDAPSWDSESALQWCRVQGYDSEHCYAKRILLDGPWEDTTER